MVFQVVGESVEAASVVMDVRSMQVAVVQTHHRHLFLLVFSPKAGTYFCRLMVVEVVDESVEAASVVVDIRAMSR